MNDTVMSKFMSSFGCSYGRPTSLAFVGHIATLVWLASSVSLMATGWESLLRCPIFARRQVDDVSYQQLLSCIYPGCTAVRRTGTCIWQIPSMRVSVCGENITLARRRRVKYKMICLPMNRRTQLSQHPTQPSKKP
jgi:hypothetical protein